MGCSFNMPCQNYAFDGAQPGIWEYHLLPPCATVLFSHSWFSVPPLTIAHNAWWTFKKSKHSHCKVPSIPWGAIWQNWERLNSWGAVRLPEDSPHYRLSNSLTMFLSFDFCLAYVDAIFWSLALSFASLGGPLLGFHFLEGCSYKAAIQGPSRAWEFISCNSGVFSFTLRELESSMICFLALLFPTSGSENRLECIIPLALPQGMFKNPNSSELVFLEAVSSVYF